MITDEQQGETTVLAVKTARMASFVVLGRFISLLILTVSFVVIARLLGPANYGIYTLLFGISGFIGAFGNFSIGQYLNERIPALVYRKKKKEASLIIGDSILFTLIMGILLLVVGILLSGLVSNYVFHSGDYAFLIDLSIFGVIFYLLNINFNSATISINEGPNTAIAYIAGAVFQAALAIALIVLGYGILGALSGYIIGLAAATFFQIYVMYRKLGISYTTSNIKKRLAAMFKFSLPLTYSNITITLVTNFSVIILGIFASSAVVGTYGVATKVSDLIDVVLGSISLVLIPMFSEAISNKSINASIGKFIHYSIYFGILFTAPMIIYITIFAQDLIQVLFRSAYANSILYMQLISIGIFIGIFGKYVSQFVISTGKSKRVFRYSLIVAAVQFLSLLILTPLFQAIGVIVAMLYIGGIAANILYLNYIKIHGITIKGTRITKLLAANLVIALVISILHFANLLDWIRLILGLLLLLFIYPVVVARLGGIAKEDMEVLYRVSTKIPFVGSILHFLLDYTVHFL